MTQRAGESRDEYLERVLIGGRERVEIVIADPDPGWADRFAVERERIAKALGGAARLIEHVGSTSVPGLAAKPIIDIVLTVDDVDEERLYAPALRQAGYVMRVREEGHRMLRTPQRDVHVHIHSDGDGQVARLLALRDRLLEDAGDRSLYERTKRALATRTWTDMNDYADAKSATIEAILRRASMSPSPRGR